jgi:hypothetical protein
MEKVEYGGWPNCYRLANDLVDLVVTTDVGPRIVRFGFVDDENEFGACEETLGSTGDAEFHSYGGHRFWHAPEVRPRTYYPDNFPIEIAQHDGFVRLTAPVESTTGIQKVIDVSLSPDEAHVQLTHRLINHNVWAVEIAPWALSVMAQGGKVIIPLPPRGPYSEENLLPTGTLTLWAYVDMMDPRWTWGRQYVMLRQDPKAKVPQKIGASVPDGWAAYARGGHLFVTRVTYVEGARYPDFGSSVETYTDADILEVETVAPLVMLEPGAEVEHVVHWFLFRDVPVPESDADVEKHVLPCVRAATVK